MSKPEAKWMPLHITKEAIVKYPVFYKLYYDIFDKKVKCAVFVKLGTKENIIAEEEKNLLQYGHPYTKPYIIDVMGTDFKVSSTLHFSANGFIVFLLHYSNKPNLIASIFDATDAESHVLNICKCFNEQNASMIMKYLKMNNRLTEIPPLENPDDGEKTVAKTESAEVTKDE